MSLIDINGMQPVDYSRRVSDVAVAQLALCFLLQFVRFDAFTVAPLVALYAVRERDRRALMLYLMLLCVGAVMDLAYILLCAPGTFGGLAGLVQLVLKLVAGPLGVKLHDLLPDNRFQSVLQADIKAVIERVLQETLAAIAAKNTAEAPTLSSGHSGYDAFEPGAAGAPAAPLARSAGAGGDGSWNEV